MRLLRILFWLGLLGIAVATLGPIDLRPESGLPPQVERFGAYLLISLLWTLAYPRQRWAGVVVLVGVAGVLELLQELVPGRHGRLHDAEAKAAGVMAGAAVAMALAALGRRRAAA